MTIDGRMEGISEGVSTYELGGWMLRYGAETAMNMDGGGSTTMIFRGKKMNGRVGHRSNLADILYFVSAYVP